MGSVELLRPAPLIAHHSDRYRVSLSGRRRGHSSPSPAPIHHRRYPAATAPTHRHRRRSLSRSPAPIHHRRSSRSPSPVPIHRRRISRSPSPAPIPRRRISRSPSPVPIPRRRISRSPSPAPIHRRRISRSPSPAPIPRRRSPSFRRRDDRNRWSPYHRPGRPYCDGRPLPADDSDDEGLKGLSFTDYRFSKRQKLRMNLKPDFMWRITPSPPRGEWVLPESPVEPEEGDRKKLTRKSRVSHVNSSESQSRSPPRKRRSRRKNAHSSLSEEGGSSESGSDSSPTPKRRKATRHRRRRRRERSSDESEESDDSDDSDSRLKRKKHKLSRRSKKKVSPDVGLIGAKKPEINDRGPLLFMETQKKPVVENEPLVGPSPLPRTEGHISYGGALRPGEGDAIAQYVQQGKRIPRRGEVGLSADEISKFESLGFVMSGSRHQRMTAIRIRKENQVYSAEDKRALAMYNYEEKAKRDHMIMADLHRLVQRHVGQDTGPAHDPFAPKALDDPDD